MSPGAADSGCMPSHTDPSEASEAQQLCCFGANRCRYGLLCTCRRYGSLWSRMRCPQLGPSSCMTIALAVTMGNPLGTLTCTSNPSTCNQVASPTRAHACKDCSTVGTTAEVRSALPAKLLQTLRFKSKRAVLCTPVSACGARPNCGK